MGGAAARPGKRKGRATWLAFGLLLLAALALRLVLAYQVEGYQVDINCFRAWSGRMAAVGPTRFYDEGYFCDYPPGALLALWPIGLIILELWPSTLMFQGLNLLSEGMSLVILKLVPILCDLIGAVWLFAFARKRLSPKASVCLALLYAFNPAALVNGAAWGQMDSLLALLMMLTASQAIRHRWKAAVPLFVVGALVKPQALLLAPVALVWLLVSLIGSQDARKQLRDLLWGRDAWLRLGDRGAPVNPPILHLALRAVAKPWAPILQSTPLTSLPVVQSTKIEVLVPMGSALA